MAVDGVDLMVPAGTVYSLLGPNGAGKTIIIRILATLLRPSDGWARVFGHDVLSQAPEVRRRVSLTGQFASVDEDLTGNENLLLLGMLLGLSRRQARARAEQLLVAFDLEDAGGKQVQTYSGGMRRGSTPAARTATAGEFARAGQTRVTLELLALDRFPNGTVNLHYRAGR